MSSRRGSFVAVFLSIVSSLCGPSTSTGQESLEQLLARFERETGAKLIFEARDLPPGKYHDLMPGLPSDRRRAAAEIACRELRKLPPRYLERVGLHAVGIFASCASKDGDGFRKFDEELGGYRYYGIYNGVDAIAGAYYTDDQLPLTLHHEIFHHVDRLANEVQRKTTQPEARSEAVAKILDGRVAYPGLNFKPDDLATIQRHRGGQMLIDCVSEYAKKNPAEDMAETARYLMSHLPDSMYQVSQRSQLPGSQRLLHVLDTYARVPDGRGPNLEWFVALAGEHRQADREELEALAVRLLTLQRELQFDGATTVDVSKKVDPARRLLDELEQTVSRAQLPADRANQFVAAAAERTYDILRLVLQPRNDDREFTVRGQEDAHGINWTLRNDIAALAQDADRLKRIAAALNVKPVELQTSALASLRLTARYSAFIADRWRITAGTGESFDRTRRQMLAVVEHCNPTLARQLARPELRRLGEALTAEGTIDARSGILEANQYLGFVDREIEEPALRATIRAVQPTCVRLGSASGVSISPDGLVLTAAHVPQRLSETLTAMFPDDTTYKCTCIAIDHKLDVALCQIKADAPLPYARLAASAPAKGDRVVCIGQPALLSARTGQPTGYQPFNVSVGKIRGIPSDPLAAQTLGGIKHDAWTYWGHSGSPLFNDRGEIVAMHNSWDPNTSMRHAVTHEAIVKFLRGQQVAARWAPAAR